MPSNPNFDPNTGLPITRDAEGKITAIGTPPPPSTEPAEPTNRPEVLSSHSPAFSADQRDAIRESTVAAEVSRFTAKRPGATDAEIDAVRAKALASVNEALEQSGFEPIAADEILDPADEKRIKMAGVAADPREFQLDFQQKQQLDPERYAGLVAGSTQWGRDMGFGKETGSAVLNYLASEGPRIAKMSLAEKAAYAEQQQTLGVKLYGLEGFKALRDRALASLKNDEISSGIRTGAIGHSVQLLSLLDLNAKSIAWVVNRGRR